MNLDRMIICQLKGIPDFLDSFDASSLELAHVAAALAETHERVLALLRRENAVLAEMTHQQLQHHKGEPHDAA